MTAPLADKPVGAPYQPVRFFRRNLAHFPLEALVEPAVRTAGEGRDHRHLVSVGAEARSELVRHHPARFALRRKYAADKYDLHVLLSGSGKLKFRFRQPHVCRMGCGPS